MVPRSVLNVLRRELVSRLDAAAAAGRRPHGRPTGRSCPALRAALAVDRRATTGTTTGPPCPSSAATPPRSRPRSRRGITTIYVDYQDIKRYGEAVALPPRAAAASIFLATPRIEKPGEANLFRYLVKQGADGLLVRNAGGLYVLRRSGASRSWPTSR